MKVYISGPMTGMERFRFEMAEQELTEAGHTVVNPVKLQMLLPGATEKEERKVALEMLDACDTIFMLAGWEKNEGCNAEMARAIEQKMTIVFEGGKECPRVNKPEQETLPQRPGMKFIKGIRRASSAS